MRELFVPRYQFEPSFKSILIDLLVIVVLLIGMLIRFLIQFKNPITFLVLMLSVRLVILEMTSRDSMEN